MASNRHSQLDEAQKIFRSAKIETTRNPFANVRKEALIQLCDLYKITVLGKNKADYEAALKSWVSYRSLTTFPPAADASP